MKLPINLTIVSLVILVIMLIGYVLTGNSINRVNTELLTTLEQYSTQPTRPYHISKYKWDQKHAK